MRNIYTQRRIKGGGNRGSAPPGPVRGGHCPPPEILASKKSKEDLEELCYFIHNILNPNDPLLKTFIDYRLISTYWEIVSMSTRAAAGARPQNNLKQKECVSGGTAKLRHWKYFEVLPLFYNINIQS